MKPIIFAVCGPSCAGKNWFLFKLLTRSLPFEIHYILSDTTRPKRAGEQNGIDYNFISVAEFQEKIKQNRYLECCVFNNWYYGTPKDAVQDAVNIGIFNAIGIDTLLSYYQDDYEIIPIFLDAPFVVRLKRYVQRQGFNLECIRRMIADYKDFKQLRYIVKSLPQTLYIVSNDNKIVEKTIPKLQDIVEKRFAARAK